jgi:asparagine synthase (glutamine-hydrolysing)
MTIIHGILSYDQTPDTEANILTMIQATEDFADSSTGYRQMGQMTLAANLLKTLPGRRHESEPVVTDVESGLSIVADVRIDNRDELFQALSVDVSERAHISDVRLILLAFKKWHQDCAEKLLGDFAFAIWDSKHHCLYCCRDVFAKRPFYYYCSSQGIIFSSDLAALQSLQVVPKRLDERFIADRLGGLHLYPNNTPYQDIQSIDAAHWLKIDDKHVQTTCYWQPNLNKEIRLETDQAYVDAYLDLFTQAVNCRLASDDPVASFISGGLDASSVSVVTAGLLRSSGQQLHSYCHVLPQHQSNPKEDEKELVKLIVDQEGIINTWVSSDIFVEDAWGPNTSDIPVFHHPYMRTSMKLAQQKGCKVFLSGFGGDQVATCHAENLVDWQIRGLEFTGFYRQAKTLADFRQHSLLRTSIGLLRRFYALHSSRTSEQNISDFLFKTCAYNHQFLERIDAMSLAASSNRFKRNKKTNSFQLDLWNDLASGIYTFNNNAAFFSRYRLEARHPMLDRRLVEFCLAVPPEQHRMDHYGRGLIRRAMKNLLPDEVRLRQNKRYSSNPGLEKEISGQLEKFQGILDLAASKPEISGYIDLKKIKHRLDELPLLVEQNRLKDFKMGATMRSMSLVTFMLHHYA